MTKRNFRLASLTVAATLVAGLMTACSNPYTPESTDGYTAPAPAASASSEASASPEATTPADEMPDEVKVGDGSLRVGTWTDADLDTVSIDAESKELFGAKEAKQGVALALDYTTLMWSLDQPTKPGKHEALDFGVSRDFLTGDAWTFLEGKVAAANKGDEDADRWVRALFPQAQFADEPVTDQDGKVLLDKQTDHPAYSLLGTEAVAWENPDTSETNMTVRLTVAITYKGALEGKDASVTETRVQMLNMLPAGGEHTWAIASWGYEPVSVEAGE